MANTNDTIKVHPTGIYHREPCLKAECFDDGEFIGPPGHVPPHYHSVDPSNNDFLMKVDSKGNYL
jgi:hypothetical protein